MNDQGFEKLKRWILELNDKEQILIIKNKNGVSKVKIRRETEYDFDEAELDI